MTTSRRVWLRVNAPKPWRAKANDELIGSYIGSKMKSGQYGDYKVHYVKSRAQIYYVSGAILDNLFSLIAEGAKVKLVFKGVQQAKEQDRTYKLYELYTEDAVEFTLTGVA